MSVARECDGGFTLIELALVLAILGGLAAFSLAPLTTQHEARQRRETTRALTEAVEALYGHALLHGRLPCPDRDGDGEEDRAGVGLCAVREGLLPAVTLGVAGRDAWQSPLRYHVTAATPARPDDPSFTAADDGLCDPQDGDLDLCTRGELEIRGRGDDPRTVSVETHVLYTIANGVPAVVFSGGANGRTAVPPPSADEARNLDGSGRYVLRDYARGSLPCADDEPSAPACAFDDLLAWIAPTVLANRLVRAGRLP